jgi:HlyD family secretion protein
VAARDVATAQVAQARARLQELERGPRADEVGQTEAAVQQAREREQNARREAERAERLFQGGALSQQQRDQAVSAVQVAAAALDQARHASALVREGARPEQIAAQRAVVAQAEAGLARASETIEGTHIVAPFAGTVTIRHREPGETVAPGTPVLTLLDPNDRWVRIYVPEDRIGRVRIGQKARITADTYPDRSYEGEVVHIGSEAEFTPRNVQTPEERTRLVYPVKVRISGDASFDLKPGVPADVRIEESSIGGAPTP